MHVGRERPREGRAWAEEGGSRMGVAHAPLAALLGRESGAEGWPAAQSAAGVLASELGGCQEHGGCVLRSRLRQKAGPEFGSGQR